MATAPLKLTLLTLQGLESVFYGVAIESEDRIAIFDSKEKAIEFVRIYWQQRFDLCKELAEVQQHLNSLDEKKKRS